MLQALLVYFDHIHIWKVSGCSNCGPLPFFDVVAAYFWMVLLGMEIHDILAKMQCLCSGGKNKVNMRDHDPWFIPYVYEMDDWVVFWCTMLVLDNIPITKLHWRICEIKMIPIRITLVKWWWTTMDGRRETHPICLVSHTNLHLDLLFT